MATDDDMNLGDEDEEALRLLREAEERLRTTPPRCLDGFKLEPSELKGVSFDGHGEPINKVYKLRCACGHDHFRALGHYIKTYIGNETFFSDPFALECANCGKVTELFDASQHGYNAELGYGSEPTENEGQRTHFACDKCGIRPMTAHARFEHAPDTLEDSTGEFTGNEHNLFTWFSLVGECEGCGRVLAVADHECA